MQELQARISNAAHGARALSIPNAISTAERSETDRPADLNEHRQILQGVIESLPDAVLSVDVVGTIDFANTVASHRFGVEAGATVKATGMSWLESIHSRVLTSRQAVRGCDRGSDNMLQQFTDEGEEQFFVPSAVPVFNSCGLLARIVITLIDVTRLRRVDEWNHDAIALFSHELRTPLASLHMSLGMLNDGTAGPLTAKQACLIGLAVSDLSRLSRVIERALGSASSK